MFLLYLMMARQYEYCAVVGTSFSASAGAIYRSVTSLHTIRVFIHAAINRTSGRAKAGPYDDPYDLFVVLILVYLLFMGAAMCVISYF